MKLIFFTHSVGLLEVEFDKIDPFGLAAIEKHEEALLAARERGVRVKALLLCSPHNPLGLLLHPTPPAMAS
jgi:histidinol-phosphate/aromatic aminotransferase/cobyric acid decarboxylase-like protein